MRFIRQKPKRMNAYIEQKISQPNFNRNQHNLANLSKCILNLVSNVYTGENWTFRCHADQIFSTTALKMPKYDRARKRNSKIINTKASNFAGKQLYISYNCGQISRTVPKLFVWQQPYFFQMHVQITEFCAREQSYFS